jgi:hypothetical protein
MSEVAGIIEQIKEAAAAQGMKYRRTENRCMNAVTIIHCCSNGEKAFDVTKPHCVLTSSEGKTRNCQAFRELSKMLAEF